MPAPRIRRQISDIAPGPLRTWGLAHGLTKSLCDDLLHLLGYVQGKHVCQDVLLRVGSLVEALYSSPHPDAQAWLQAHWRRIGSADVDLVLLAAEARFQVTREKKVTLEGLAAFSGVMSSTLRNYGSLGILEVEKGAVSSRSARKWLGLAVEKKRCYWSGKTPARLPG